MLRFKRDFGSEQFKQLKKLYDEANSCLQSLSAKYPEHIKIWNIAKQKLNIIDNTIRTDEMPTDDRKRDADLSIMLTHELYNDFFNESNELEPLYKLSKAYTLFGMKDIKFE